MCCTTPLDVDLNNTRPPSSRLPPLFTCIRYGPLLLEEGPHPPLFSCPLSFVFFSPHVCIPPRHHLPPFHRARDGFLLLEVLFALVLAVGTPRLATKRAVFPSLKGLLGSALFFWSRLSVLLFSFLSEGSSPFRVAVLKVPSFQRASMDPCMSPPPDKAPLFGNPDPPFFFFFCRRVMRRQGCLSSLSAFLARVSLGSPYNERAAYLFPLQFSFLLLLFFFFASSTDLGNDYSENRNRNQTPFPSSSRTDRQFGPQYFCAFFFLPWNGRLPFFIHAWKIRPPFSSNLGGALEHFFFLAIRLGESNPKIPLLPFFFSPQIMGNRALFFFCGTSSPFSSGFSSFGRPLSLLWLSLPSCACTEHLALFPWRWYFFPLVPAA